jgi:hypothetical protein
MVSTKLTKFMQVLWVPFFLSEAAKFNGIIFARLIRRLERQKLNLMQEAGKCGF